MRALRFIAAISPWVSICPAVVGAIFLGHAHNWVGAAFALLTAGWALTAGLTDLALRLDRAKIKRLEASLREIFAAYYAVRDDAVSAARDGAP